MPGHSCAQCVFCFDKDEIARKFVTEDMHKASLLWDIDMDFLSNAMSKRQNKIIKIRRFTLDGWVGCSVFYLFQCLSCGKLNVDYAHGYTSDGSSAGLLYLTCSDCESNLILYQERFYTDNNIIKESVFSRIRAILKLAFHFRLTPN